MSTKCPKCHTENPDSKKFCGDCGTPLEADVIHTKTLETPKEKLTRGSTFADRYEIIEELGKGGMGKVYRVEDKKVKEEVALKLIKPEIAADKKTIERFRNELRIARKIRNKNVCAMFDLSEEKGSYFITMEFISGQDLKGLIRQTGQLTVGKAISIAKQICEGLTEAHSLDVVHRDLKPNNIMIDRGGNAKIMDFGIARSMKDKEITGAGVIIGTPEYMSPEQAEAKEVDQRSDIYSLGVILYEMVTGRVPFEGETALGIAMKHKSEAPQDPREINAQIPEDLSNVILRCMEKDKERRYQGAEELLSELSNIEKGIPTIEKGPLKREPETEKIDEIKWKNSIAVLPFADLSQQKDQEYFCDGVAEELINVLTQVQDLRVVARTSAFSFKGKDVDVREIGKKLNVENILEGSVRKASQRVRITAQLINVADGYHLWSERFDREMTDVFAVQDEIAQAVSTKMKTHLQSKGEEGVPKRYTENVEAYNLYLKGIYWRRILTVDRVSKSLEYFNRAIEKDPGYALAYAGLAYAYQILYFYSPAPSKDQYPKALKAAMKALELDDGLAEAHEALAVIKSYWEWDWEGAERELRRTLELNPGYIWAHFHLANIHLFHGRFDEALGGLQKIHDLDPLNAAFIRNISQCYLRAGQLREAEEALRNTLEIDPFLPPTWIYLGYVLLKQSRYEEALEAMRKDSVKESVLELNIGIVYARMGKREEALRILNDWLERSEKEFASPYFMALLCFALGKNDLGFQWLEKGYEEHDSWLISLKVDFLLDDVRDDPRYQSLLKKMNLE